MNMTRHQMYREICIAVKRKEMPSIDKDYICSYRGYRDGIQTKCVVGLFIPNVMYKDSMDRGNYPITTLFDRFPHVQQYFMDRYPLTIQEWIDLQTAHDQYAASSNVSSYDRKSLKRFLDIVRSILFN